MQELWASPPPPPAYSLHPTVSDAEEKGAASLASVISLVCTACALAIGLLLRHGAHVLHARHPRALALLLLLLIVILVGATAAPAALLLRDVVAEARLAVLNRTLLNRERLLAAAPSFALVTASTAQLGMIASFLLYRRGLLLEDIAAAERVAAHRRKQLPSSISHTAAAASSLMV